MTHVEILLGRIRANSDCLVLPVHGVPTPRMGHVLPADLTEFYGLCGGVRLFSSTNYALDIVPPAGLVEANPEIVGEVCPDDISDSWYIVVRGGAEEAITIDLSPKRLGRCYDSFWDRHGVAGSCAVIALSFTELLERLVDSGGSYWFWLDDAFPGHGDAYLVD